METRRAAFFARNTELGSARPGLPLRSLARRRLPCRLQVSLIEAPRSGGHELDNLVTLCGAHHRASHRGELTVEGPVSSGLIFRHVDGTDYGGAVMATDAGTTRKRVSTGECFVVDGSELMNRAEARATQLGAQEISVDTSDGAIQLIEMYRRRGYRHVGCEQWEHTNFRSVLMSKRLLPS